MLTEGTRTKITFRVLQEETEVSVTEEWHVTQKVVQNWVTEKGKGEILRSV